MKTIFEVRTSKFHGHKLVSRHKTAERARKAAGWNKCSISECKCSGDIIEVVGKNLYDLLWQGGTVQEDWITGELVVCWIDSDGDVSIKSKQIKEMNLIINR